MRLDSRRLALCLLGAGLLWPAFAAFPSSNIFEVNVSPKGTDNFYEAGARLWIPEGSPKIEAVLILLNGTDSDARPAVFQPDWQEFARRQHLALAGCYFRGDGEPYEDASRGSGKTLLDMLAELARQSGRPEIRNAPLLFVGHSAGAMFSYNFTCWRPEAVLAFVSLKSGPISPTGSVRAWSVPGLFIVGDSDLAGRVRSTATAYLEASKKGASRWAFALEPGGGHGSSTAIRALVQTYLEGVLALKLNRTAKAPPLGSANLGIIKRLDQPKAEPIPSTPATDGNGVSGFSSDTAWLPGESTANAWQKFVRPVRLVEFAKSGGREDRPELQSPKTILDFGELDLRKEEGTLDRTFVIDVSHLADPSFTAEDPSLRVVCVEKRSEKECLLTLGISKQNSQPGYYRSSVKVVARSGESINLLVRARIFASYAARPPAVYVGVIPRGFVAEMPVAIVSDSGQPLKIVQVRSSRPEFAVARETGTGKLLCRFDGARGLGNQSGHFEVTLAENPPRQLKIPFIVWVSKKEAL